MKKILVILGHPNKDTSLSSALAKAYIKGAKESNAEIKYLVLADLDADFIKWPGDYSIKPTPQILKAQQNISWADHIVFIYPTWWSSFPALLKGFFDRTFTPGFAYNFKSNGRVKKLLVGKTAHLITTTGGKPWIYKTVFRHPGHKIISMGILRFSGFKKIKTTILGPVKRSTKHKIPQWIKEVEEKGKKFI